MRITESLVKHSDQIASRLILDIEMKSIIMPVSHTKFKDFQRSF